MYLNTRNCVVQCEKTGNIGDHSIQHCEFSFTGVPRNGSWYMQEPLYLQWKQLNCRSDCRYYCMMQSEYQREKLGLGPAKYHGKWPFKRVFVFQVCKSLVVCQTHFILLLLWLLFLACFPLFSFSIQEPLSAVLSAFNLLMHFIGWLTFFILVSYKLPLRPQSRRTYYEYTGLWHIYGLLSMNAWYWSAIFHTRDFDLTEKLDYSSAVAVLGYSLILSLLRIFNVKDEASRVMFAAPILAFVTTHILYLNFYEMDYGWNMKVCLVMGVSQILMWVIWGGVTRHPSRFKLWTAMLGCALAMLLEIYDFPPFHGYVDAHALWHATTIPLTYLWWSFIKDDAKFRTSTLVKKVK
ncbi:Per1-like [Musa troglodytarum]|uniref:Post-GPI attachment to proteins factor 3 n=1 Tax=Musa troglodytarum TaxID=320322 RepID=A0A9E7ELG4_9LILI|nr:Per1-like [Musa troglodytarum]